MSGTTGSHFKQYPLWVPHYGVSCPRVPSGWSTWTIWQDSESGTVSGIGSGVDTNFFKGSHQDLDRLKVPRDVNFDVEEEAADGAEPDEPEQSERDGVMHAGDLSADRR